MKKTAFLLVICLLAGLVSGCGSQETGAPIVATTLPVYDFASAICEGTGLAVTQLVNEPVSCLHDYTLQVSQMRTVEAAQVLIMSGGGLEAFLHDVIHTKDNVIDASQGIELFCPEHGHDHEAEHDHHDHHHHSEDPHIWLSPVNAMAMAQNICDGLIKAYPEHQDTFQKNLQALTIRLQELDTYGKETLKDLSCRDMVTFHDGFHYLADAFGLHILKAIEEEPGSETSAQDLVSMITLVRDHELPAIFTEANGSTASANVISAETGCSVYSLSMIMFGTDYFGAMYQNIDAIKEALG